jgi:lysophospholipase L1-like esterase
MKTVFHCVILSLFATGFSSSGFAQQTVVGERAAAFGPYEYEVKPDHEAFSKFNPRKAPAPGGLLLKQGDRLAICGDSITEQKMYSRMIETYLTVCVPHLRIAVRQYGWSGEKTDGFLRRMDNDVLTFAPTIATLAYGMNDSRYRPFDINNGQWYEDHYTAIVRRFKEQDVRVIVGSPGCAGKIAEWVKSRSGSLDDHNLHLCALRDIAIGVAHREDVRFADIFWPMYQAQVFAPGQHSATEASPYNVAGRDGIHPGWAGQVIMAWSFLRAMGLNGDLGTITLNLETNQATGTDGHVVDEFADGLVKVTSHRYPFCARGDQNSDASIRSGMTLVPFMEDLNRFVLKVEGVTAGRYSVQWGDAVRDFDAEQLAAGIVLPAEFPDNPFCDAFDKVDNAVLAKQTYETPQVKSVFHSAEGKANLKKVIAETEAIREPLATAIANAMVPVQHSIQIRRLP